MKYVIIEDEDPAALRLEKMIREIEPDSVMVEHLVSVKSAINFLKKNTHPDLIFLDIQLGDGISFDIFEVIKPDCPVIFTTAYDQFAIQAFKVNSIDYLLKPVKKEELAVAVRKFKSLNEKSKQTPVNYDKLLALIKGNQEQQKRLLIRFGDTIKAVEINDVAYFYTENKINYLCTFDSKNYPIDQNLDQIESITDHAIFFRINRQFIVNIKAISKMISYSKSRVKLLLIPITSIETIVSTERSPNFKIWLTGSEK